MRNILQELRMYNPNYLERPYVVVLNKTDLPEVRAFMIFYYLNFVHEKNGWLLRFLFVIDFYSNIVNL